MQQYTINNLCGTCPMFLPNVGFAELTVVFVIILILFGPGKLPEFCKALGNGIRQFKDAVKDDPSAK